MFPKNQEQNGNPVDSSNLTPGVDSQNSPVNNQQSYPQINYNNSNSEQSESISAGGIDSGVSPIDDGPSKLPPLELQGYDIYGQPVYGRSASEQEYDKSREHSAKKNKASFLSDPKMIFAIVAALVVIMVSIVIAIFVIMNNKPINKDLEIDQAENKPKVEDKKPSSTKEEMLSAMKTGAINYCERYDKNLVEENPIISVPDGVEKADISISDIQGKGLLVGADLDLKRPTNVPDAKYESAIIPIKSCYYVITSQHGYTLEFGFKESWLSVSVTKAEKVLVGRNGSVLIMGNQGSYSIASRVNAYAKKLNYYIFKGTKADRIMIRPYSKGDQGVMGYRAISDELGDVKITAKSQIGEYTVDTTIKNGSLDIEETSDRDGKPIISVYDSSNGSSAQMY